MSFEAELLQKRLADKISQHMEEKLAVCTFSPCYIVYFGVCSYSAFPSCVGPISCVNWQPHWKAGANFHLIRLFRLSESRRQSGEGELTVWVEVGEMGWLFTVKAGSLSRDGCKGWSRNRFSIKCIRLDFGWCQQSTVEASKRCSRDGSHVTKRRVSPKASPRHQFFHAVATLMTSNDCYSTAWARSQCSGLVHKPYFSQMRCVRKHSSLLALSISSARGYNPPAYRQQLNGLPRRCWVHFKSNWWENKQ